MSTCTEPACGEAAHARGLCWRHYQQARRGRLGEAPLRLPHGEGRVSVGVRLDRAVFERVRARAAADGCSPSEWIRRAVAERVARQPHQPNS